MMNIISRSYVKEKWSHAGFQKYFQNISWMIFARAFTMGISLLTTLYIARTLGPMNFGELDYALAIIGLFSIIGTWGMEGILNRELIKYPERHNELIGTAAVLRISLGIIATLLIITFALFTHIDYLSRTLLILLSFTQIISAFAILQQTFLARAESKFPSLITIAVTLVTSIAKIIILLFGKGVIYLAASIILESTLYAVLFFVSYIYKLHGKVSEWKFSSGIALALLKTGISVAFMGIFAMIYSRIDQIMIRHLLDATAVGLYSSGVRLVDVWGFIPTIIGAGLYPAVLNARKISEQLYIKRLRQMFVLYLFPAIGIATVVSLGAKPLMLFVYGNQFISGFPALQVYVWSLPGTFIGLFVMSVLFTDDQRKVLVFTTAFPALLNVLLNFAWIPTSGIIGAAWATTISYSLIPLIPLLFKNTRTTLLAVYRQQ